MPEVILNGPDGRLEARYMPGQTADAPIALFLHPHPKHGGSMNNRVIYNLYHVFQKKGFGCLRFNFRGVGRSQGVFDKGEGELADAASALDWLQNFNESARSCWLAGFSFGAWIGMQLLMRRPEVNGFIAVAPPTNMYDFSFLAPCPASGLIINGDEDSVVPQEHVDRLVSKLRQQKGITIDHQIIPGAGHLFTDKDDALNHVVDTYLDDHLV